MMHRFAFCFLFIGAVYSLNEPVELSATPSALSICSAEGFKCTDSCTKLVRCFINGNNTYSSQVIRTCPAEIGKLCNLAAKDCSSYFCEDEKQDSQPINCHEDGVFPHPSNCTAYFNCSKGVFTPQTCGKGLAYNGAVGYCTSDMLEERPCLERPIPRCTSIEDIGAYEENSSIFYACAYNDAGYLLPELRRCQSGYKFDDDEKRCNSAVLLAASSTAIFLSVLMFFRLYV